MTGGPGCPTDRSDLLRVLDGTASRELEHHVNGCDRCTTEVEQLRSALSAVVEERTAAPDARVRRAAVAYARSQVGGGARRVPRWRAPAAAVAGAVFALFASGLATARLTGSVAGITALPPGTLVLASAWAIAAFLYASPSRSPVPGVAVAHALAGATMLILFTLALPISDAVALCARWTLGGVQLSPGTAMCSHAAMSGLYGALTAGAIGMIRGHDLSWAESCWVACLVCVLVAPHLFLQADLRPTMTGGASVFGAVLGTWFGARWGPRLRS